MRGVVAAAADPRVRAERARVLRTRAVLSCWIAFGIIPFTVLVRGKPAPSAWPRS